MKTASAKAKGRRLQQHVAQRIRTTFSLPESDVKSLPMGAQGADVWMSNIAQSRFPFAIECKNQEKVNVWSAFAQARENVTKKESLICLYPLLVFSRNRDRVLCVMEFDDLLELMK